MARTLAWAHASPGPFTPSKATRTNSRLQDSPFSDYFTDEARSPTSEVATPAPAAAAAAPPPAAEEAGSPEKRQLLVRLNSVQSQLMQTEHEDEQQTMNIVERKVREIEAQLNALHSQTRQPPEMEDSGLFMEEDEDDDDNNEEGAHDHQRGAETNGSPAALKRRRQSQADRATAEQKQAESDYLLLESQRVLESVTTANEQLRHRLEETKTLHDQYTADLEARDQEIEALRVEKEALQADLRYDHSELLFLQLQFKALEAEIGALDQGAQRLESYAPEIKADIQRVKRERIAEEMGKWRRDWEVVDGWMEKRRRKYLSAIGEDGKQGSLENEEDIEGEWRLETSKETGRDGKVQSITIQRLIAGNQPHHSKNVRGDPNDTASAAAPGLEMHYTDISTQTDPLPLVSLFDQQEGNVEDENGQGGDDYDCAITTSSEDNDYQDAHDERKKDQQPSALKTAWQELWEGLSGLAGMGEDRF